VACHAQQPCSTYHSHLGHGGFLVAMGPSWVGCCIATLTQWFLLIALSRHYDRLSLPSDTKWVDGRGRLALITGVGFNGVGYFMCRSLLQLGFHVVFADVHSEQHMKSVRSTLIQESGAKDEQLEYIRVDLTDWDSIRNLVSTFREKHSCLDLLVNNAGGMVPGILEIGYAKSWMLNYLAPMSLTLALLDLLQQAPNGRVVFTCSSTPNYLRKAFALNQVHRFSPEQHDDMFLQYGRAKFCIATFTKELQRRLVHDANAQQQTLRVDCFHPGPVGSNIWHSAKTYLGLVFPAFFCIVRLLTRSPEEGSLTGTFLAASENVEMYPAGDWWFNCSPKPSVLDSMHRDLEFAKNLWEYSREVFESEYQAKLG